MTISREPAPKGEDALIAEIIAPPEGIRDGMFGLLQDRMGAIAEKFGSVDKSGNSTTFTIKPRVSKTVHINGQPTKVKFGLEHRVNKGEDGIASKLSAITLKDEAGITAQFMVIKDGCIESIMGDVPKDVELENVYRSAVNIVGNLISAKRKKQVLERVAYSALAALFALGSVKVISGVHLVSQDEAQQDQEQRFDAIGLNLLDGIVLKPNESGEAQFSATLQQSSALQQGNVPFVGPYGSGRSYSNDNLMTAGGLRELSVVPAPKTGAISCTSASIKAPILPTSILRAWTDNAPDSTGHTGITVTFSAATHEVTACTTVTTEDDSNQRVVVELFDTDQATSRP